MKAMKPFYFVHPQNGKLRVVVIDGKLYYCLMDVKNMKGFWNSTIALLDDMAEKRMIRGDWRDVIEVADNLEELTKLCEG